MRRFAMGSLFAMLSMFLVVGCQKASQPAEEQSEMSMQQEAPAEMQAGEAAPAEGQQPPAQPAGQQ